ncbi:conserved phage C-terminal domain-containing protein [Gracilibacillus marinus]|uniref:Conserved phage C-terminal domain-containing protein n=1 Tax=Gracilibacillus marinus TaxID=630535 RepID=A0ABV8VVA3_9BACI
MSDSFFFPVFSGILTPYHIERIGPALWEFLWLVSKTTKEVTENNETIGIVLGGKPVKLKDVANELGRSERTVKRNVSRLKEYEYILTTRTPYGEVYKVRNSKKFTKKRSAKNGTSEKEGEVPNMSREVPHLSKRSAKNGTSNKDIKDIKDINNIYVEIIDYLNKKTGKRFSPKSQANRKLINGRLAEDRTLEDFKNVIDVKVEQWLNDDKMQAYIRPATLFAQKNFENYLNEKPVKKVNQSSDPRDKEIAFQKFITDGGDPNDFNWSN